jgi:hypothetical protein
VYDVDDGESGDDELDELDGSMSQASLSQDGIKKGYCATYTSVRSLNFI